MQRKPEPEIMDDAEQAIAYARADFSDSNQAFVDGLIAAYPNYLGTILDLGCGPADIPIRIIRKVPSAKIVAVDASPPMVELARKAIKSVAVDNKIEVMLARIPGLDFKKRHFQAIISKDLLHHLPDPGVFWAEIARLTKKRTALYVMDLFRPASPEDAKNIVETVAANEAEILKRDFYNSLLAAFTIAEINAQVKSAGLDLKVEQVSERHLLVHGILATKS